MIVTPPERVEQEGVLWFFSEVLGNVGVSIRRDTDLTSFGLVNV